jgi:hypothetical protein
MLALYFQGDNISERGSILEINITPETALPRVLMKKTGYRPVI